MLAGRMRARGIEEQREVNPAERAAVGLHIWLAAIGAVVLALPMDVATGWRLLGLVAAYNLAVPVLAVTRRYREWLGMWVLAALISLLQIYPGWFLVSQLRTLSFPADGSPWVGGVPAYMAGMWAIPLFLLLTLGRAVESRQGRASAYLAVAAIGGAVFFAAEALLPRLPAWRSVGVTTVGDAAVYVLGPQVLLALAAYYGYRNTGGWGRTVAAAAVMLLYFGAVAFAWFVVERGLLA